MSGNIKNIGPEPEETIPKWAQKAFKAGTFTQDALDRVDRLEKELACQKIKKRKTHEFYYRILNKQCAYKP